MKSTDARLACAKNDLHRRTGERLTALVGIPTGRHGSECEATNMQRNADLRRNCSADFRILALF